MKYLHTMIRVSNLDESLDFFVNRLGFVEQRRHVNDKGRYTLVFVACPESPDAPVELTYNWDPEVYGGGRNFGVEPRAWNRSDGRERYGIGHCSCGTCRRGGVSRDVPFLWQCRSGSRRTRFLVRASRQRLRRRSRDRHVR